MNNVVIEQAFIINDYKRELSNLLINIVESGASIGFIPPMSQFEAEDYWNNVLGEDVILLIAKINEQIVGTIQVHLCTKQNGGHRAEIAKLMTHPDHQRKGIGFQLMKEAEKVAKQNGRSLLVLDTREGDVSNLLYKSMGYIEVGKIPQFALSVNGQLDSTVIYYKSV